MYNISVLSRRKFIVYEEKFLDIISQNAEINEIFTILEKMHLRQATICGGTIRNLIWNTLTGRHSSLKIGDIDVYYHDPSQSYEDYLFTQEILNQNHSLYLWNLQNIALPARHASHIHFYDSIEKTLAGFPETCTSIGVQRDHLKNYQIIAPYGLTDLFNLNVKPTPGYRNGQPGHQRYVQRINNKNWATQWPELKIEF
nr:nucleotidyltransferase family protein [Ligilactobacillus pobuzihii]